ncbi:aminoglycoside phosphotransferase family protein [Solirubrobacter ginsenosidimutans]|uniref:Aminoglycoside phosphotransferase family protein n=1 Tax=Solirubrobacter ginsenosidimutans TaxID=490573 RepID=A0A9X3MSA3_9ACTN|nr:aminoglycoside phosphotransferase family protein [Solirubrobacter ginsenosidimutans]MDA0161719.1 aminoglycoside phosphotransferase family protein [Solirubrobacter ginsenosidimutans]
MLPALPERLRLQFLGLIGEQVKPWLDDLPGLVGRLCREWDVQLEGTFAGGWSAYVAFGTRRGEPVVLKVAPRPADGRAEIGGLVARDGVGVPRLLCHDLAAAALLLPRVQPGVSVNARELRADEAAGLLRRLHVPVDVPPEHVPLLRERLAAQWAAHATRNRRLSRSLPDELVADAASAAEQLSDSWSRSVLLHGDFEARNLLHAAGGLVAIDSPAAVGDPGYDAASWVMSEHDGDAQAFRASVAQFVHALAYPEQRLWRWAWPLAVDSLLAKLSEPGWSSEAVGEAFAVAGLVAGVAAPDWRGALAERHAATP